MRAFHWKNNQKYLVSFSKPNSVCCKFVYLAHCLYFQCAELCLPSCTWLRFIKTIDERIKRKQRKPFQNQNETQRNKQRKLILLEFSSFQFSCCRVQLFATQWTAACQASLSISSSWSLLKLMSIESVMPFNHLILCCPLLLLTSVFPRIRGFSIESVLHIRGLKYWCFNFSISASNEYSGLISFRMDWLDLLQSRDSQESSPTPQFKSNDSSLLSFLYGPTLTSIHDYWKNHSFE